jgi:MFS family permease
LTASNTSAPQPAGWRLVLRALSYRNYRLFFGGQSISLIGTWMTRIATSWLVYRLTDSAFLLGVVGFSGQIFTFLLAPFAGVWVDRWDRHRTLVVTQVLSMLQSLALAALALSHIITVGQIIVLSLLQGAINAFDIPARQAFVVQMVENREHLGNAIALNSSMVNAARLIGPSIAGLVIAAVGEGYCFLIDGLSFIAVIVSLLAMRVTPLAARAVRPDMLAELREGWEYVSTFVPIRSILLLLAAISLVGMPYTVLMPVVAVNILHGGPDTLGFLMAASGVGALAGAIHLAARKSVLGLGRLIAITAGVFGAALMAFAMSHWLWLCLLLLPVAGFAFMQQMAASNTILQTIVREEQRGRVMSYYSMAFLGMVPFGSLFAGMLAAHIGVPLTLALGGAGCIAAALWFAGHLPTVRSLVRPIYVELGIIPEVAAGIQTATALQTPPKE